MSCFGVFGLLLQGVSCRVVSQVSFFCVSCLAAAFLLRLFKDSKGNDKPQIRIFSFVIVMIPRTVIFGGMRTGLT